MVWGWLIAMVFIQCTAMRYECFSWCSKYRLANSITEGTPRYKPGCTSVNSRMPTPVYRHSPGDDANKLGATVWPSYVHRCQLGKASSFNTAHNPNIRPVVDFTMHQPSSLQKGTVLSRHGSLDGQIGSVKSRLLRLLTMPWPR
jgi:hypothetical protein